VRYLREQDIQFLVGEREFHFLAQPYALKLALGGEVVEDGSETARYCLETGRLTVRLPKKTLGQVFEPPTVIENGGEMEVGEENAVPHAPVYYGFNSHHTGVFVGLEEYDILELPDPERVTPQERRLLRVVAEESKFDGDYYLGDLMNAEDYSHVFSFQPFWTPHVPERIRDVEAAPLAPIAFSEQDTMLLARLRPKSFILENASRVLCGLVDLLFAYVYHELTMAGEESCEASWTVSRLSRLLGWLDDSEESVEATLRISYRRALCYPLYRNWQLCVTAQAHVSGILRAGKRVTLKCLLNVHHCMTHNAEKRYLLNVVFVDDYIAWLQAVEDESVLWKLGESVAKVALRKEALELNLVELERFAADEAAPECDFMDCAET
jgi:protein SHQ1